MSEPEHCPAIVREGGKPVTVMHEGKVITVLVCDRPKTENGMCERHQPGGHW